MKNRSSLKAVISVLLLIAMLLGMVACAAPGTGITDDSTSDEITGDVTSSQNGTTEEQPPESTGPRVIYYEDFEDLNVLDGSSTIISKYKWEGDKKTKQPHYKNRRTVNSGNC